MLNIFRKHPAFSSAAYWEERYKSGGNSGQGSYNELAVFKAEVLNNAFENYQIGSVLDFGCGDGNQLSLLRLPDYTGFDVSETILKKCIERFASDKSKSFFLYNCLTFVDHKNIFLSDACISIDVLFHLVEINIFRKYLADLFSSSSKLVIIYAADLNHVPGTAHEVYRAFTPYIEEHFPDWELKQMIKNKFPSKTLHDSTGSLSNFYFFEKKISGDGKV